MTCDLPSRHRPHQDIDLADPGFGCPGKIDILLGIDIFVEAILHGPMAFETHFGWVLAGSTESCSPSPEVATCHVSCMTGDDLLQKFWEIEDAEPALNPEERSAIQHFKANQTRNDVGRFIVPLREYQTVRRIKNPSSTKIPRS